MPFDYQQALFHVGVRVPDLEAGMAALTAGLGLTWAQVVERDQALWTPERGQHTVRLRFTYSCEGPQHVELLQGEAGSMWDAADAPGVHHQGVWVDDVGAEVERFVATGWTLEAAGRSPDASGKIGLPDRRVTTHLIFAPPTNCTGVLPGALFRC
jgi:hypothetical protein